MAEVPVDPVGGRRGGTDDGDDGVVVARDGNPVGEADVATGSVAEFGARFSAYMVDATLLFGLTWIGALVLARQLQGAGLVRTETCNPDLDASVLCEGPDRLAWALVFVFIVGVTIGAPAWFHARSGATPGKRAVGLRVVDRATGGPIGVARGVLRSSVRQAPWLFAFLFIGASRVALDVPDLIWWALAFASATPLVWASFAPSGRGAHDLAADSVVVSVSPAADLSLTTPPSPAPPVLPPSPAEEIR